MQENKLTLFGCDLAYRTGQEHFTAISELLQQNNIDPVVLVEIEL